MYTSIYFFYSFTIIIECKCFYTSAFNETCFYHLCLVLFSFQNFHYWIFSVFSCIKILIKKRGIKNPTPFPDITKIGATALFLPWQCSLALSLSLSLSLSHSGESNSLCFKSRVLSPSIRRFLLPRFSLATDQALLLYLSHHQHTKPLSTGALTFSYQDSHFQRFNLISISFSTTSRNFISRASHFQRFPLRNISFPTASSHKHFISIEFFSNESFPLISSLRKWRSLRLSSSDNSFFLSL